MAFGVSLFVVIDFVKLGCVVSEVGCSILEIDLVKQAFLVRAIFFELLFWNAFFVEIDFGRIVSFTTIFLLRTIFFEMLFWAAFFVEMDVGRIAAKEYFL